MPQEGGKGSFVVSCIYFGLGIAILVFTVRLYDNTKENPFTDNLPATVEERRAKFFNTPQFFLYQKKCICGNEILNDFCTEEQIQLGCKDSTLNQQNNPKLLLRYLKEEIKCDDYEEKILDLRNTNLGQIFVLNFDMINKMALGLIILAIIGFAIIFVICCSACSVLCCGEFGAVFLVIFLPIIILFGIGASFTELVLFIILCVNYNDSNISDYVEFLNCGNINRKAFDSYSAIENVYSNYTPFMVLYIIFFVINCLQHYCNFSNKKK